MGNIKSRSWGNKIRYWFENSISLRAVRKGLMLSIPFLLIGSFCTVITSWPMPAVHEWIVGIADGMVYQMLLFIQKVTIGNMVLPIIIGSSFSYANMSKTDHPVCFVITSLLNFMIIATTNDFLMSFEIFNSTYVFTAVFVTILSCWLLKWLFRIYDKLFSKNPLFGIFPEMQLSIAAILPVVILILIFILGRLILCDWLEFSINNFGMTLMKNIFMTLGTGFLGSVIYLFFSHILWFFGIHGDHILSYVGNFMFDKGMTENIELVAMGEPAVNLFTKTFFNSMILMGGSGATLCLLFALLIGSKQKSYKKLFGVSILPAFFNINEIVIFGMPVVLNPIMIIPFILTPIALLIFDTVVVSMGLVPCMIQRVEWTTPIFFSGYLATGSYRGAVLQLCNLLIGIGIYLPFVKWYEKHTEKVLTEKIKNITDALMEAEQNGIRVDFDSDKNKGLRNVVNMLERDLAAAIRNDEWTLFYQPQMNSEGKLYGVEALLRWKHPIVGYIYPPLIIEIAKNINQLEPLGFSIIKKAAETLQVMSKHLNEPISLSVNISADQLKNVKFKEKVVDILKPYDFGKCTMCFEVTEQEAMVLNGNVLDQINGLREYGIPFHMDDFGMGHSSMMYLQNNEFSVVKLDGCLVRDLATNQRSLEIIRGIQEMSESLHYVTIAEYVETKEQMEILKEVGCNIYQGWYYSKAVSFTELKKYLMVNNLYIE